MRSCAAAPAAPKLGESGMTKEAPLYTAARAAEWVARAEARAEEWTAGAVRLAAEGSEFAPSAATVAAGFREEAERMLRLHGRDGRGQFQGGA